MVKIAPNIKLEAINNYVGKMAPDTISYRLKKKKKKEESEAS